MYFGQLKIKRADVEDDTPIITYDPEDGLKYDARANFGHGRDHPTAQLFATDKYIHTHPDQFTLKAHGGGVFLPGIGMKQTHWGSDVDPTKNSDPVILKMNEPFRYENRAVGFIQRLLGGTGVPEGLHDTHDDVYANQILEHKDKIKRVLSLACNGQGTTTPETFEKMFGHDLDKVIMNPPGKLGLNLSNVSNYLSWLMIKSNPNFDVASPLRTYEKVDGDWTDTGMYKTKIDHGVDVTGAALGTGLLGYGTVQAFKKPKLKNELAYRSRPG